MGLKCQKNVVLTSLTITEMLEHKLKSFFCQLQSSQVLKHDNRKGML